MIKPGTLREAVKKAVPALQDDPGKLLVFVDKGRVLSHGPGSLSFEYAYTLNLVLTDMTGSADPIMVAVLEWAQVNQPELLVVNEKRNTISFEVDQLTHDSYDLSIELPLTEAVTVTQDGAGARQIQHVVEQAPEEWMR
mgnify:CR=1 FL=1